MVDGAVKLGAYGGINDGKPCELTGKTRLTRITIQHGGCIGQLGVMYKGDNSVITCGTDKGGKGDPETINLGDGEYITGMHGYYGPYKDFNCVVRSLFFVTNKRKLGPYGKDVGTPFKLVAENGHFVGFHGSADAVVNAIGVYVKPNVKPN